MSKYTQGKLRAEVVPQWIPEAGDADRPVMLLDEQGREVAFLSERYDSRLEPTYEADANRLVSCWNALAGRDPAALDGLVDAVRIATIAYANDDWHHDYIEAIRDALAAFQGGGE